MHKRSQSISINTIIIAAIALAVLVVLFAIFTGRIGSFSQGLGETASCENSCKALGMDREKAADPKSCRDTIGHTYVPGTYSDVTSGVCCCNKKKE